MIHKDTIEGIIVDGGSMDSTPISPIFVCKLKKRTMVNFFDNSLLTIPYALCIRITESMLYLSALKSTG